MTSVGVNPEGEAIPDGPDGPDGPDDTEGPDDPDETITGASTVSNIVSGGPTRVTKSSDDDEAPDPITVFGTSIVAAGSSIRVKNGEESFRSDCGQYGQC